MDRYMYVCAWGGIVYDMLVLVLKEVSGALVDVCVERSVSKRVYMTRTLTYTSFPTLTSTRAPNTSQRSR